MAHTLVVATLGPIMVKFASILVVARLLKDSYREDAEFWLNVGEITDLSNKTILPNAKCSVSCSEAKHWQCWAYDDHQGG